MATFKLADLSDKYKSFVVPSYQVKINNTKYDQKSTSLNIQEISVELTAEYEASGCQIVIANGVEFKDAKKNSYQVEAEISKNFKLGNKVEISLGYAGAITKVFEGFISGVELVYQSNEGFQIYVECMDLKVLMMNSFRSQLHKDIKKYHEAVKEVLKKYASVIKEQKIQTTDERSLAIEQHYQSDYDFIVSLAKKLNYTFYVSNGDVYFEPLGKDSTSQLELKVLDLISFTRSISLSQQISQVTVRINDELDPGKPIESKAEKIVAIGKGKNSSSDISKLISKDLSYTLIDPSVTSVAEAKLRAEGELNRKSMNFASGHFKCIGIPELVPGKMLTISGFGLEYDNDYYVKKIVHKLDRRGYITSGELGVNKI